MSPPVVLYTPVDAGPIDPEWVARFPTAAAAVAYTDYGRHELIEANSHSEEFACDVVPHGVDTQMFRPLGDSLDDTLKAKRHLGLVTEDDEDSFIVLNANRNQQRKRVDLTLEGFAQFARGKPPGVQLMLHMGRKDIGWDIEKLGRRLGIEERLVITGPSEGLTTLSNEQLNTLYNAADVGLNTSGGEGWGLPAFEHAATGKPQVLPAHPALREIWEDAAVFIETPDRATQASTLSDLHFTRPEIVAAALEQLYASPRLREECGRACFERATEARFSWDTIASQWKQLFGRVLAERE